MTSPAESYEHSIVPHLFRPWAERLVDQVAPQPGERVLDVACGTGIVARQVVTRVGPQGRVIGTDVSPAMLEVAEHEAKSEGAPIDFHTAPAESQPLPDESVDVVLCQQGLQFTPDRAAAAREMHRVLAPGGRLGLSVWREIELHPFFRELDRVIRARLDVGAASLPFSFGDPEELRDVLAEAGFVDIAIEQPSMPAHYPDPEQNLYETVRALVAVAPSLQSLDDDARERMIEEISADMRDTHGSMVEDGHVVLQWHANVAFARRAA